MNFVCAPRIASMVFFLNELRHCQKRISLARVKFFFKRNLVFEWNSILLSGGGIIFSSTNEMRSRGIDQWGAQIYSRASSKSQRRRGVAPSGRKGRQNCQKWSIFQKSNDYVDYPCDHYLDIPVGRMSLQKSKRGVNDLFTFKKSLRSFFLL